MYHLVKLRYQREDEAGKLLTHNESYLFQTCSWTETEARVAEKQELGEFHKDLEILAISPFHTGDIAHNTDSESDYLKWYKLKYYYLEDSDRGAPKRTTGYMTIEAEDSKEALAIAAKSFSTWLITPITETLTETKILEVFPYENKD